MSAPPDETRAARRNDMLSDDEERTLSRLRDIVARLRASRVSVEITSMEEEIQAAGGSRVHSLQDDGPDTFVLSGTRFTLRPSGVVPGRIELSFIPLS